MPSEDVTERYGYETDKIYAIRFVKGEQKLIVVDNVLPKKKLTEKEGE